MALPDTKTMNLAWLGSGVFVRPAPKDLGNTDFAWLGTGPFFVIPSVTATEYTHGYFNDAIIAERKTKEYSVDAIIVPAGSKTYQIDAILAGEVKYQTDAIIRWVQTKDYSTDTIIGWTGKTYSIDTTIFATEEKEYSVDSYITNQYDKTYQIDAIIDTSYAYRMDAIIFATEDRDYEIDSYIVNQLTYDYEADTTIVAQYEYGYSIDLHVRDTLDRPYRIDVLLVEGEFAPSGDFKGGVYVAENLNYTPSPAANYPEGGGVTYRYYGLHYVKSTTPDEYSVIASKTVFADGGVYRDAYTNEILELPDYDTNNYERIVFTTSDNCRWVITPNPDRNHTVPYKNWVIWYSPNGDIWFKAQEIDLPNLLHSGTPDVEDVTFLDAFIDIDDNLYLLVSAPQGIPAPDIVGFFPKYEQLVAPYYLKGTYSSGYFKFEKAHRIFIDKNLISRDTGHKYVIGVLGHNWSYAMIWADPLMENPMEGENWWWNEDRYALVRTSRLTGEWLEVEDGKVGAFGINPPGLTAYEGMKTNFLPHRYPARISTTGSKPYYYNQFTELFDHNTFGVPEGWEGYDCMPGAVHTLAVQMLNYDGGSDASKGINHAIGLRWFDWDGERISTDWQLVTLEAGLNAVTLTVTAPSNAYYVQALFTTGTIPTTEWFAIIAPKIAIGETTAYSVDTAEDIYQISSETLSAEPLVGAIVAYKGRVSAVFADYCDNTYYFDGYGSEDVNDWYYTTQHVRYSRTHVVAQDETYKWWFGAEVEKFKNPDLQYPLLAANPITADMFIDLHHSGTGKVATSNVVHIGYKYRNAKVGGHYNVGVRAYECTPTDTFSFTVVNKYEETVLDDSWDNDASGYFDGENYVIAYDRRIYHSTLGSVNLPGYTDAVTRDGRDVTSVVYEQLSIGYDPNKHIHLFATTTETASGSPSTLYNTTRYSIFSVYALIWNTIETSQDVYDLKGFDVSLEKPLNGNAIGQMNFTGRIAAQTGYRYRGRYVFK